MNFYLLLLLVSSSYALDFNCLKGPKFWCTSFTNAQKCGRITECYKNEKNGHNAVVKMSNDVNGAFCDMCQKMVVEIENALHLNVTEEEVVDFMVNRVCAIVSDELKALCQTMVRQYSNQVYMLVKGLLDPNFICRSVQICTTSPKQSLMPNRVNGAFCDMCQKMVVEIENDLKLNLTEEELVDFVVDHVCSIVNNELKVLCQTMVRQYSNQIYMLVKGLLDPNFICRSVQICTTSSKQSLIPSSPETCKICKEVFNAFESILSIVTPDELKALLKTLLCNNLPGPAKEMCNTLVDGYTDQVYELLKSLLDGDRVCPALHLCASQSGEKLQVWSCQVCMDVVVVLRKDLVGVSAAEMEALVRDMVCSRLPFIFRGACDNNVDHAVQNFINDLNSPQTPQQLCAKNTLCLSPPKQKVIIKEPLKNVIECDSCELVVGELKKLLVSPAVEIKLKNFIKTEVCKYFGSQAQQCINFVDKYSDILINFINNELTSRQICTILGACTESGHLKAVSPKNVKAMLKSMKVKSFQCNLCQFVVNETRTLLSNPSMQNYIENFLKAEICSRLGPSQQECINDINEYYSFVVNIILEFLTPSVCTDIHLCATKTIRQSWTALIKAKRVYGCETCSLFYKHLKTITTSTPNNDIVLGLVGICSRFYHDDKSKCLNQLKHMDVIFEALKKANNEKQFCEMSRICDNKSETVLLGQKPCAMGPGFWCISRRHAELCGIGAVRHCEATTWKANPTI